MGSEGGSGRREVSYCRLMTWRNFKAELSHVVRIAVPLIGSFVSLLCTPIVGYVYLGHIDDGGISLAAASLSHLFANMTGVSICAGLLSGFDTLASQAYGAKNFQRVGILFQRSLALMAAVCVPVLALWLNAERVMLFNCDALRRVLFLFFASAVFHDCRGRIHAFARFQ
jgi:MATE family multidrug resistance protein